MALVGIVLHVEPADHLEVRRPQTLGVDGDDRVIINICDLAVFFETVDEFRAWFGRLEGQAADLGLLNDANEFADIDAACLPDQTASHAGRQ